jgi:hypothetical protein
MVRNILSLLLVLGGLTLAGCGDYGNVEQGRTVAFDKEKAVVSIIVDTNLDVTKPPTYTELPPHDYILPEDRVERGADPTAALRMNLDVEKKIIKMYNPKTKAFEELPFEVVADHKNVELERRHPLVWDSSTRRAIKFPKVDEANRTIEIYSRRQHRLTTIKLSDADFGKYKKDEWDAGDEVRIYYREKGKAIRFMNITKTNLYSR